MVEAEATAADCIGCLRPSPRPQRVLPAGRCGQDPRAGRAGQGDGPTRGGGHRPRRPVRRRRALHRGGRGRDQADPGLRGLHGPPLPSRQGGSRRPRSPPSGPARPQRHRLLQPGPALDHAHLEGYYYKPRIDKELLAAYSQGLICLSGCVGGELPQAILSGDLDAAERVARQHLEIFGADNYFLELQDHGMTEETAVREGLRGDRAADRSSPSSAPTIPTTSTRPTPRRMTSCSASRPGPGARTRSASASTVPTSTWRAATRCGAASAPMARRPPTPWPWPRAATGSWSSATITSPPIRPSPRASTPTRI